MAVEVDVDDVVVVVIVVVVVVVDDVVVHVFVVQTGSPLEEHTQTLHSTV